MPSEPVETSAPTSSANETEEASTISQDTIQRHSSEKTAPTQVTTITTPAQTTSGIPHTSLEDFSSSPIPGDQNSLSPTHSQLAINPRPLTSTIATQIVSLGPAGLEVINSDTESTSTYVVPSFGATQVGSSIVPASVAVYQGHTLTLGGPAATVTSAVVILSTQVVTTSNATASGPAFVTSSSNRLASGILGIASLAITTLFLM